MHPPVEVPETAVEIADRIEDEVAAIPDGFDPSPVDPAAFAGEMTRKKQRWARTLQDAPPAGVKPSRLESASGLKHTWTQDQLRALLAGGVITKVGTGRYVPVPGQDVWAGLEKIRTDRDQLARELAGV